jgi:hypothetical protein
MIIIATIRGTEHYAGRFLGAEAKAIVPNVNAYDLSKNRINNLTTVELLFPMVIKS